MSPLEGIGPEQLKIRELLARIEPEGIEEIVLCTNPNTEGEVTAMYLARQLGPLGLRVTRLASGLPVGGDLEYADELTLGRALEGRREVTRLGLTVRLRDVARMRRMDLADVMRTQHACRYYRPDPVPPAVFHRAVELARFGPQGGNRQPVRFLIVTDAAKKRQLAEWYLVPWKAYLAAATSGQGAIEAESGDDKSTEIGARPIRPRRSPPPTTSPSTSASTRRSSSPSPTSPPPTRPTPTSAA